MINDNRGFVEETRCDRVDCRGWLVWVRLRRTHACCSRMLLGSQRTGLLKLALSLPRRMRGYEAGPDQHTTLAAIANILQVIGC